MEIKVPDPGPVKEAIDHMQVKPQYFWIAGLVLAGLSFVNPWSSTGVGIAAAGAFIAAAWVQSVMMTAFFNRPPVPPTEVKNPSPPPPPPQSTPPHPLDPIDLEPAPNPPPPPNDGPNANNTP